MISNPLQAWMDRSLDSLAAQTAAKAHAAMAALGCLVMLAVGLVGVLWLADDMTEQAAHSRQLSDGLARQQKRVLPSLAELRQQQAALAQELAVLDLAMVDPANAPSLWLQVQAAAEAYALKVISFQPGASRVQASAMEPPALLKLRGSYAQLARWVTALAADSPAVSVLGLSLVPEPGGLLLADVSLTRQLRQTPSSATSAVAGGPLAQAPFELATALPPAQVQALAQISDPFARPVTAASADMRPPAHVVARWPPDPLQAWPLAELQLVGLMARQGQAVGLVQVAGRVHAVRAGDGLGQDHGEVLRIDEGELVLREWVRQPTGTWTSREVRLGVGKGRAP